MTTTIFAVFFGIGWVFTREISAGLGCVFFAGATLGALADQERARFLAREAENAFK